MSLRKKVYLPVIGNINYRRDGFGTQVLKFSNGGETVNDARGYCIGESLPSAPIKRGYVKIWYDGRVVDRALTTQAAHRRIKQLKAQGFSPCAT